MTGLSTVLPVGESLFGRDDLTTEIWNGVQAGRRHFGLEGATGVGKSALLERIGSTMQAAGYIVAEVNAAEQASEELAISAIYSRLKDNIQEPGNVVRFLCDQFLHDTTNSLRKVFAAVAADLMKLATDKADKTIEAIQEITSGVEPVDGGAADQLEALGEANRRLFLTRFLKSLQDAGNKPFIAIDNLDLADLTPFMRYLLKVPGNVVLAVHNTERSDNESWDLVYADIEASGGIVRIVESLERPAVMAWAEAVLEARPSDDFIEEMMAATGGRPHDIRMILESQKDGGTPPPQRDYRRYYALKRGKLSVHDRTIADLLAVLPRDKSIAIGRLAIAAAALEITDTSASLDHLRRQRLLKENSGGIALVHSIAQDFWCEDLKEPRLTLVKKAWYTAFRADSPYKLTTGTAVAMLPIIASGLLAQRSVEEISEIGVRLVEVGQIETGLRFLDLAVIAKRQPEAMEEIVQHALLAAQTRLQLGRYQEVDEPLTLAELSAKEPQERFAVLLLRMKLALRRNSYEVLWKTYADIKAIEPIDANAHAEVQSILNVAYRDLLNYDGIRATALRLKELRGQLDEKVGLSIDRVLARAFAKLGEVEPALEYAESALMLANAVGSSRDLGNAYLARAEVHRYSKNHADAEADYNRAAEIARGTGNRDSLLWSLLGEAAVHLESGQRDRASSLFQELRLLLNEPGYEHPIEAAHLALLQFLAGAAEEPVPRTVERYRRLNIEWPVKTLTDAALSLQIYGPIPL